MAYMKTSKPLKSKKMMRTSTPIEKNSVGSPMGSGSLKKKATGGKVGAPMGSGSIKRKSSVPSAGGVGGTKRIRKDMIY